MTEVQQFRIIMSAELYEMQVGSEPLNHSSADKGLSDSPYISLVNQIAFFFKGCGLKWWKKLPQAG